MAFAMKPLASKPLASRSVAGTRCRNVAFRPARQALRVSASAASDNLGFDTMRDGIKVAADESLLTPRSGGRPGRSRLSALGGDFGGPGATS